MNKTNFRTSAFDDAAIGIAIVTLDGKFAEVNDSFCNLVGYTKAEVLNLTFMDVTHPEDLQGNLDLDKQLISGEIPRYTMEKRYIHKAGHVIWIQLTVSIKRDEANQPDYYISQVEDISQRKEYEQNLIQANQSLKEFASIASHDLKTPLNGIRTLLDIFKELYGAALPEDGNLILERILSASSRMGKLIDELINYSLISEGNLTISEFELAPIIQEITEMYWGASNPDSMQITCQVSVPQCRADKILVHTLLRNLINNAIKYNNKEMKKIHIGYDPTINFYYVEDNGIGIPRENLNDVFKPFNRLHGETDYGGGTGAGLAFVKKIIERHKGSILIESTLNKGTKILFRFGERH